MLAYIKEITMTVSTQSFSRCRTRMIRILLSEKASQTLNSISLKCIVCMDKLKLLILSQVITFVQLVFGLLFIQFIVLVHFEVYIQPVFEL